MMNVKIVRRVNAIAKLMNEDTTAFTVVKAMLFYNEEQKRPAVVLLAIENGDYNPDHRQLKKRGLVDSHGVYHFVFAPSKHGELYEPMCFYGEFSYREFTMEQGGYTFVRSFPWLQGEKILQALEGVISKAKEDMDPKYWV